MFEILDSLEDERGCGYRKEGGMYLVSGGVAAPCGKLPIPLTVCPCCSAGIKPSRGWTWINGTQLAEGTQCRDQGTRECAVCPLSKPTGRVGLLWIGEKFYGTPDAFGREAAQMGVSRRISAIPKDFKLGETWVWMAHRKAITNADGSHTGGIVFVFKPERIEYVVKADDDEEKLQRMADRGITLVRVHKKDHLHLQG